jgi:acetylornithine/N-succinyldiaminopimelate aminotransferase
VNTRELFLRHQAQTSFAPLGFEVQEANGIYLYDLEGKPYIDLISGISVSALGHGNQAVQAAITAQASRYLHVMVYGEMILSPQVKLAEKLSSLLPDTLNKVYFTNSGAEAIEGAIKLARRYTGRSTIVSQLLAYHGSTAGALSLMSDSYFTARYRPLVPGVRFIAQNNTAAIEQIDRQTAAVVIELIQAERGCFPAEMAYVQALAARCIETGTLLMVDEIQTGMGRTGSLFAFEQYGIVPDILVTGKAFGAGMPLAAFIASGHIMDSLAADPVLGHITTFGGHPVCCAAALAGLGQLESLKAWENATTLHRVFSRELAGISNACLEGKGALLALHLGTEERCRKTIAACLQAGLITDWFLFAPAALRIAPPLIMTEAQATEACKIIRNAIEQADA